MSKPVVIKQWRAKDFHETSYISISTLGTTKVVEIEYSNVLDELLLEFSLAKGRREKGIVREKYRQAAMELNSQYKKPVYNTEI